MSTKKHHDDEPAKPPAVPTPAKGEQDIAAKPAAPVGGGFTGGAAPDPALSPDPNQDTARENAMNTYNAKLAAGENPGEMPVAPVAIVNQPKKIPTGPVAAGYRRVKVVSPVATGAGSFGEGDIVDMDESDADSLGVNVEAYGESADTSKKHGSKK